MGLEQKREWKNRPNRIFHQNYFSTWCWTRGWVECPNGARPRLVGWWSSAGTKIQSAKTILEHEHVVFYIFFHCFTESFTPSSTFANGSEVEKRLLAPLSGCASALRVIQYSVYNRTPDQDPFLLIALWSFGSLREAPTGLIPRVWTEGLTFQKHPRHRQQAIWSTRLLGQEISSAIVLCWWSIKHTPTH